MQRVDQASRGDDGGAMLIVVEDGDVHQLAQALLDDETIGRLDVFQIDAAESGREIAHAIDEGVHVVGVHFQIDGVHIGEALEQYCLALHHRLGSQRAQIAQAQNGGAVRDHRHKIAARGIVIGAVGMIGDRTHRHSDARAIGQRQIALCRHRLGGSDLDLAGLRALVKGERFLVGESGAVGHARAYVLRLGA